jgi:hypothetical protein
MTLTPSFAKAWAIANPMPLVDPVTTADLPFNILIFSPRLKRPASYAVMIDKIPQAQLFQGNFSLTTFDETIVTAIELCCHSVVAAGGFHK